MAMTQTSAKTVTFESAEGRKVSATFNGKVYNGKRYINCSYRINNTNSGLKQMTAIWQDGLGWVDCRVWGDTLVDLFGLE